MGGKKRPKTAKSGKSGGKKGKKGKKDEVEEPVDLGPKEPETQKLCPISKNIMIEPVKLGDAPHVWFDLYCIKHAKAS